MEIVNRYKPDIFDPENIAQFPPPRFLVGEPTPSSLDMARAKTVWAYQQGKLSPEAYQREIQLIEAWKESLEINARRKALADEVEKRAAEGLRR